MKEETIILDINVIKQIICNFYNIKINELNKKGRARKIVEPRQMYHYFARMYTKETFQSIGGNFHYATVLHSEIVVKNRLSTEASFCNEVREIELQIINYFYSEIGNYDSFKNLKYDIIQEIISCHNIDLLNKKLTKFTKKTEMKNLKKQFEIDLNNESPVNYLDKKYLIGGEMRNVAYFGRYGTALRTFDENLFNKLFAERLTALLQVNDMDVICENIEL